MFIDTFVMFTEKHKHKRSEEKEKIVSDEPQPGTSGSSTQKVKKASRTSSKEKKLVRGIATYDEPTTETDKGKFLLD